MSGENLRKILGTPTGSLLVNEINLGDIITLQSGEDLTIRSIANFGKTVADVSGFLILGECKYLLTINSSKYANLYKYSTQTVLHKDTKLLLEGSVRFWSNHLPGVAGAMGEIQFRMLDVPGNLKPWFYIYRGPERMLFKPESELDLDSCKLLFMPRSLEQVEVAVVRHAVTIAPLTIELPFEPAKIPEKESKPVLEPEHTR